MLGDHQTCPKCGALVTPQLKRCRQCNTYLHGSALEGFLVETILPERFASSPGTGLLALLCILYYFLMLMLAGPEAFGGFRPMAILQMGATTSTAIYDGQYWRFVASVFSHGSFVHIGFNLYALSYIGPLVESLYDRRRVIVFFVLTGVASMAGAFAIRMFVFSASFSAGSVGASGAVSGLLGVGWWATRNPRSEARDQHDALTRWLVLMIGWGFLPGIDGLAHAIGLLVGIGAAALYAEGNLDRRWKQQAWTTASLLSLALVMASLALTLQTASGYPFRLENDAYPRTVLFFTVERGSPWKDSSQYENGKACNKAFAEFMINKDRIPAIKACELAIRSMPWDPAAHEHLGVLLIQDGNKERGNRQRWIASQLVKGS